MLKTDYGQQEAIAVFGSDPRVYQTTVKEFYKDEAGQVCGALIAKLESRVVDEPAAAPWCPPARSLPWNATWC